MISSTKQDNEEMCKIESTNRRRSLSDSETHIAFNQIQQALTGSMEEIPGGSTGSNGLNSSSSSSTSTRTSSLEAPILSSNDNISTAVSENNGTKNARVVSSGSSHNGDGDGNGKKKDSKKREIQHNYTDHANDDEAIYSESPIVSKGGVTVPFPLKLHNMLEYIAEYEPKLASIVSWQPHGRCFLVRDITAFADDVLPSFFQQRKYASFQRQLNLYGFSRITKGPDRGSYYHELFLRSKQALCRGINRMKVKGTGSRMASNPKQEPNFYQMTCMPITSSTSTGHLAKLVPTPVKSSTKEQLPGNIKTEELEPEPLPGPIPSSSNYGIVTSLDPISISQDEQMSRMAKSEYLEPTPISSGNVVSCTDFGVNIRVPMPRNHNIPQSYQIPSSSNYSSTSYPLSYEPSTSQSQVFESDDHNLNFVFDDMPFHALSADKAGSRRHSLMDAARRASVRRRSSDVIMDDATLLQFTRRLSIQHNDNDDDDNDHPQQYPNTTNNIYPNTTNNNQRQSQQQQEQLGISSQQQEQYELDGQSQRDYRRRSLQMDDQQFEREMQIISQLGERNLTDSELGSMLDQIVDHNMLF